MTVSENNGDLPAERRLDQLLWGPRRRTVAVRWYGGAGESSQSRDQWTPGACELFVDVLTPVIRRDAVLSLRSILHTDWLSAPPALSCSTVQHTHKLNQRRTRDWLTPSHYTTLSCACCSHRCTKQSTGSDSDVLRLRSLARTWLSLWLCELSLRDCSDLVSSCPASKYRYTCFTIF